MENKGINGNDSAYRRKLKSVCLHNRNINKYKPVYNAELRKGSKRLRGTRYFQGGSLKRRQEQLLRSLSTLGCQVTLCQVTHGRKSRTNSLWKQVQNFRIQEHLEDRLTSFNENGTIRQTITYSKFKIRPTSFPASY